MPRPPPVHAAVFAINEAVERGEAEGTMGALRNPNALLRNTMDTLAQDYQDTLSLAKARKEDQASGRVREPTPLLLGAGREGGAWIRDWIGRLD